MSRSGGTRSLASGRYFGNVRVHEEHSGFALTHLRHARGTQLPLHEHERAYFCLVRSGGYAERYGGHAITYGPHSVLFHPPGIVHRDEIAEGGASFLIVEIGNDLIEHVAPYGPLCESRQDLRGGELAQAALRLEREWRDPARRSPLVIEGVVLEMLGIAMRPRQRGEPGDPHWLEAILDRLRADYSRSLTIVGLARDAGVHPVRLSRLFRRRIGMGIGEYVQRLRVRRVEERLGDPDIALADLALEVGFVDQSHLTRVFRRLTGITPAAARAAAIGSAKMTVRARMSTK
jgi:AraC family transcriptional regulator